MTDIKYLYETINTEKSVIKKYKPEVIEIPKYISNNLKHKFFDWQKEAFENFLIYQEDHKKDPTHLMFNMATGTGKTLLMAAMILYYYKQGYRHFIFFVNQNNIVDKTENNFIDNTHNKYLFKDKIVIDDETINIKKVETFSDNPQGIEIKFTTIHKLYNDIHIQKENQTTLEDLYKYNIVMLADEAHHFNANTKKKRQQELNLMTELRETSSKDEIEKLGWEHTVIELILKKNNKDKNNKNVLLEFTATIPANEQVAKKYEDKIIYKFTLKEFLSAGYTKEINLITATLEKKERILQALLFNWYRTKIANKHNIPNFKSVILFRSKTIEESQKDYEEFVNLIDNLSNKDFNFLKEIEDKIFESDNPYEQGKSRLQDVLKYIDKNKISYSEIAEWIRNNFQERNLIITNSKTNKTKKEKTDENQEKLLNSLEDKNNHIRGIFTVARLTEGWDVLNLFDIVRLNKGQNKGGGHKKTPESTIQEKQLIGRGVRYFPFAYKDKIPNKRKFDDDLKNELRILEELFYHTYDDPNDKSQHNYVIELKSELKKDGYIKDDRVIKTFKLKKEFTESDFYKNVKVWCNKQIDNPNRKKKTLEDIKEDFEYKVSSLYVNEEEINLQENKDEERLKTKTRDSHKIEIYFKDIEKHIFRKAINIKAKQENSLFQFNNLKNELDIKSIDDLQNENFLGDFKIKIIVDENQDYENIKSEEKLKMTLKFIENVFDKLKGYISPKIGSDFETKEFKQLFSIPKVKTINEKNLDDSIAKDNEWYILDGFVGTSEEKDLIEFIKNSIGNLKNKYKEIYLLRNEEVYKIYDFEKGRGFMPDFILFLKNDFYYQIFIEPKGDNLLDYDEWKEKFLNEITEKYGFNNILKAENQKYKLIGLPFFNTKNNNEFETAFNNL